MSITIRFTKRQDGDLRKQKPPNTIFAQQIHGNTVTVVSARDVGKSIPGADGLVYKKEIAAPVRLAVRVADCVPIVAFDSTAEVIGVAHAGWRGTLGEIAQKLIATMKAAGAETSRIHVSLGPHIGRCCYQVSPSRAVLFQKKFRIKGSYLDLGAINRALFVRAGVSKNHITVSKVCTSCCNDTYFSYRKDSKETFGEQAGMIGI